MDDMKEIIAQLENYYGNLDEPNFSKLDNELLATHRDIMINLVKEYFVKDVTGENSDVCMSLILYYGEGIDDYFSLFLSYVDKYAAVLHHGSFVEGTEVNFDWFIKLKSYLDAYDFKMPNGRILCTPINIKLCYSNHPKIFNALFSDIDTLP